MFTEQEKKIPEGVSEIPQTPETPEHIEKRDGVTTAPQQFTSQVAQNGQQLISTPQSEAVIVSIPSDPLVLQKESKGKITDSLTWLSSFWLRIIKKAAHFGWKVVNVSRSK